MGGIDGGSPEEEEEEEEEESMFIRALLTQEISESVCALCVMA